MKAVQLLQETVPGIHPLGHERDPGPLELILHQLGVHRHVFQDEYAERIWQHQGRAEARAEGWVPTPRPLFIFKRSV